MHVFLLDMEYEVRRFPFAAETPAFLLPIGRRSMLERTVTALGHHRLGRATLITSRNPAEDRDLAQAVIDNDLRTAPTLAAALARASDDRTLDSPMLIVQANLHPFPDVAALVAAHVQSRRTLSWLRGSCWWGPGQYTFGPPAVVLAAAIYPKLLLREESTRPLFDLPRIAREKGLTAAAVDADSTIVEVNNAYALYHMNLDGLGGQRAELFEEGFRPMRPNLWVHPTAKVGSVDFAPDSGLVVIGRNVRVEDGTSLCGPSLLADGSVVEGASAIHRGLLLAATWLPRESFVQRQIVSQRITARVAA